MNSAQLLEQFPMVTVDEAITRPYLDEVLVEVEKRGLTDRFINDMKRLVDGERKVELYKDFAPLSFTFRWFLKNRQDEYEPWLFGGWIFHEAGNSGFGAPVFSGLLTPLESSGWSAHT